MYILRRLVSYYVKVAESLVYTAASLQFYSGISQTPQPMQIQLKPIAGQKTVLRSHPSFVHIRQPFAVGVIASSCNATIKSKFRRTKCCGILEHHRKENLFSCCCGHSNGSFCTCQSWETFRGQGDSEIFCVGLIGLTGKGRYWLQDWTTIAKILT